MNKAIKAFLRYPTITAILVIMAVALGIHALMGMPRTEDPSITIRTGIVAAIYPGATTEQVEKQVTKTLESHIFKFQEVRKEKTYSTSRPGLAIINVELEKNVKTPDVFWAKLRHEMNLVKATELPGEVMGPVVDSDFGDTVAMLICVSGERYGYRELRDYVDTIQDALRTVPEVGKIAVYGRQNEQIWVTSSLERMSQYFTDPRQIVGALNQRNEIQAAGNARTDNGQIPLHTTGSFNTEEQIKKVMVGMSPTGQPIYIGDFASVERRYQDPEFMVRYDGKPALMISVEMQKGHNIVEMGNKVTEVLNHRVKPMLPPDLHMDYIANQPQVVEERMTHMGREFLIAIGCVIVVTVLLLPFRVSLIAALAIPTTMLTTIAVMNVFGIQLHQVSIAALIVVLGIVVDDAIVIADNYVELLDHKVPRPEAAWRSATEVLVPVLAATLTIIASFLPLIIISGSAGEFILALPITVAVALSVSFLVAVFVTPLLCRTFIHKGLHDHDAEPTDHVKKFNALDLLQVAYKKAITYFMSKPMLAVGLGVAGIVLGAFLFRFVPQEFFPNAERNQFVVDLWMPQGTRIEATDATMKRIEGELLRDKRVTHLAGFVGQSSPRFYYNVNPQQPDPAYGQFIVNTVDVKATTALVEELRSRLARLAPEGMVLVQELQQGAVMEAPIEFRISGDDEAKLKAIGEQIGDILQKDPRAQFLHTDYRNDSPMINVDLNTELANRLGITHMGVSNLLYGAFDGAPVSTFWEGDRAVNLVLRVDPAHRATFDDVRNTYVGSSITNGKVPLRAIADLAPTWQTSRLVRRNGVRTLTVRCLQAPRTYASSILKDALPKVKALKLPPGYRLELGGEFANQEETQPEMVVALGISLLAIFFILMIQFRNLVEPLVVMASIPLSLFGVVVGLLITRNSFGFTAFMGMISLCGIVVRNAIILIDYIKEKLREGIPLVEAATLAGERRLRPIFLTTMAAAVGVTPMVLSGSKMWSPLASVLAVGLIFSMFFTLLVVPVIYVLVFRSKESSSTGSRVVSVIPMFILALVLASPLSAGVSEPKHLTLEQAVASALDHSAAIRIARAKVDEAAGKKRTARADYFPQLAMDATWLKRNDQPFMTIPAGSLGNVPGLGPFPTQDANLGQGKTHLFYQNITLSQPLTQLFKIHHGNEVASAEERGAKAELRKMETEIAYQTRQAYYGLLIAQAQITAAQAGVAAAESQDLDAQDAVKAGNALKVQQIGSRAKLLQNRYKLSTAQATASDLASELNDLMGEPLQTPLDLAPVSTEARPLPAREAMLDQIRKSNPDLAVAQASLEKSRSALKAGKSEYIPELGAFIRQTHQDGLPFVQANSTSYGLSLSWTIFDWGKRSGVVHQRAALASQASSNYDRVRNRTEIDLDRLLRKLETARILSEAAEDANAMNVEKARLAGNQHKSGLIPVSKKLEADAEATASEAELLAARLGLDLTRAELDRLLGGGLNQ
ncbi:efflux RND transporter permease subunit [Geothrix sp. SG200]|uniref:efflux RND transporter permease subunit n=1 Tax=Geothrix sp. SG200 TaxID=2922865 RepID=UPI001FAB44B7|nr:efflux RND transporter permease subunit [Geothrix sp. SG200]